MKTKRRNCVERLDAARMAKCIEAVFGEDWQDHIIENGTRCEGWSILLRNGSRCSSLQLEKLRLRFNTEFRDELEKMDTNPLAYWSIRKGPYDRIEVRYIVKDYFDNQPKEVDEITRWYEEEQPWTLFKDRQPRLGQRIIVHSYSDVIEETTYDPRQDLEGICDAWRPAEP